MGAVAEPAGPADPGSPVAGGGMVQPPGAGTQLSDFAFEVKESTGNYFNGWIIDKLTTFHVGPACRARMLDREGASAVHSATFYTRDIAEYAEKLTGDDWSDIETQGNSDRETNKHLVEPMIERFRAAYGMTVSVEGDDCDASHGALWLRYWTTIASTLKDYPPRSGQAFITLDVRSDVRDVSVAVDATGTQFAIVAPRDIEAPAWSDKLAKPFRKLAAR